MRPFYFLFFVLILFSSCSLQKRLYRPGYYWESRTHVIPAKTELYASVKREPMQIKIETGCDTLFLNNGKQIICKVTEVGGENVKFRSCIDTARHEITLNRKNIYFIAFSNGTYEEISPGTKIGIVKDRCATIFLNDGSMIKARKIRARKGYIKYSACDKYDYVRYDKNNDEIAMIEHPGGRMEKFSLDSKGHLSKTPEKKTEYSPLAVYEFVAAIAFVIFFLVFVALVFNYTYLTILTIVPGIMAGATLLSWIGLIGPAYKQVNRSKGTYKGKQLLNISLVLMVAALVILRILFP